MTWKLVILALALSAFSPVTPISVSVSLLKPQGIRFTIQVIRDWNDLPQEAKQTASLSPFKAFLNRNKDEPGISLIGIHYSINSPLLGVAGGQYNYDVTTRFGGQWVHENSMAVVHPGDTVNYWIYETVNGQPQQLLNQNWVAPLPTTPTTTTTTVKTQPPTTPKPTTPVPATQAPIVTANSNYNHYLNSGGTSNNNHPLNNNHNNNNMFNNNMTSSQTMSAGSQSMTGGSVPGTGCCNCNCSAAPAPATQTTTAGNPGSQCTSYPCLIFEDEFDFLNLDVWEHEITAGGGGNWEFQYYTNNRTNSYVKNGTLFIKPTLTVDSLNEGPNALMSSTLDIWGSQPGDVCTGNAFYGCRRQGTGTNIINPIQSARLRSSRGFSFKYGKVEVEAKMPTGDWLWPAIWLLPLRNAYGRWPASGEIDIVECRGNRQYTDEKGNEQGIRNAGSTLHFGSDFWHNKWPKAHGEKLASSGTYGDGFHKYELVWDENHISISIDGDEVLNVTPTKTMWEFGGLDKDGNIDNPWRAGTKMAPFDQEFFLIMNVAVGGTAFFPDKNHNSPPKPWSDKSQIAAHEFWNAKAQWYPTWHPNANNGEDAAMQVKYIRVYKLKP